MGLKHNENGREKAGCCFARQPENFARAFAVVWGYPYRLHRRRWRQGGGVQMFEEGGVIENGYSTRGGDGKISSCGGSSCCDGLSFLMI